MSHPSPIRARSTARLALVAVAALVAAAAPARAQDWAWAEGRTVTEVVWEGLTTIHRSEAMGLIATRPGEPFSSDVLAEDLARLYRSGRFGSPDARRAPVEVTVREAGGGVLVELVVHERPRVRRLVLEGAKVLEGEAIERAVKTKAGDRWDPFSLEADLRRLRRELVEAGHLRGEVERKDVPREAGVDVTFVVRAGPKVHVAEITFEGARQLDPETILGASGADAIETKPRAFFGLLEKGVYRPDAFRRDLDRITRWYRSQGFLDARVFLLEERASLDGEALTLVVGVEEGPRYTVKGVAVTGARVLTEERILEEVAVRPGRPFLGDDLRQALEQVKSLYGRRAYVHARVDLDVRYDPARALVDVTFAITEGPRVRVGEIRVEGNDKTREDVIRRELSFYPGEYFDAAELEASVARLWRLRYFQDVRFGFEQGPEPGVEHLVLSIEEARTGAFIVGGGVSTATGFFGNIQLTLRNFDVTDVPRSLSDFIEGRSFTGAGQQLQVSIQPGRERSQYSVEFTEPWLFGYPIILGLAGSALDRVREDWVEYRRAGRFTLGYRLTQDIVFRATYRYERVRIADIDFGAVPDVLEVAGTNYVASTRFGLTWDQNLIDRDFIPWGGWAAQAYYEIAGGVQGGDFDFHRAGASANWQTTLFQWPGRWRWVLQLRGDLDWQEGLRRDDRIPIFERFFAGGPGSLRGFRFRTVTPKLDGRPLGGNWSALGTAEVTFPLFQSILRGVLLLDVGAVTAKPSDFDRDAVRVAAGFGFRLLVPVFPAPVALDFAWPLRKQRDDDPQVFSFSVGFGF